ncbi:MAG TPA: hypothetical protein VEQ37_11110 [Actinomycetota bacterium]|nr:hypothetical protein [Actinomycetota bacterium]
MAGRAAEPIVELWRRLASRPSTQGPVRPAAVDALPDAARRFSTTQSRKGRQPASANLLRMSGQIKVGR